MYSAVPLYCFTSSIYAQDFGLTSPTEGRNLNMWNYAWLGWNLVPFTCPGTSSQEAFKRSISAQVALVAK